MGSIISFGRKTLTVLLACASLFAGSTAFAQTVVGSGKVVDSKGEAIIGASVIEKGSTSNGVMTDVDGKFQLSVPSGAQLEISCIGYVSQTVRPGTNLNIVLEEDALLLDETVVVGYGTMKKKDVTGAMISVSQEDLTQTPVLNAVEALQGKAAGVVVSNAGRPGSSGSITVRGVNSFKSTSPLVVIDGIISRSVSMDMLNPQDIESIEILKDASATAIYGAMGGNGVILISTNRGKSGRFTLNYTTRLTAEKIYDKVPMMDAVETLEWKRWAYYYAKLTDIPGDQPNIDVDHATINIKGFSNSAWENILRGWGITPEQYTAGARPTTFDPSKVVSTDWAKYSDRIGITQEHSISASGGTDKMTAYVSLGYLDNKGTTRGQEYKRYTFRTSVDITPLKYFTLGGAINVRYGNQDYGVDGNYGASNSIPGSLHARALSIFPYGVPYDKDGKRVMYPDGNDQFPTVVDEVGKVSKQNLNYNIAGSFYAQLDFGKIWEPLKGLTFRSNFGPQLTFSQSYGYYSSDSANRNGKTSVVTSNASKRYSWTLDNILSWNREFGRHSFNVTLLQEAMYNMSTTLYSQSGYGVALEKVGMGMTQKWWGLNGDSYTREGEPSFNSLSENQLASYMARLNYSYDNRYVITGSYRIDGASQLGKGHKWHGFPSVALAWRMDQEDFMDNASWLDQLKVRVGWGMTGNNSIGLYATSEELSSNTINFGTEGTTVYYSPTKFANQKITWETTTNYNLGFDFSIFKGRLSGVIDLYQSYTNGLIFNVKLPSVTGKTDTDDNVGKTSNHGIDITLNSVNISTRDFSWNTTINLDYNKNKIIELQNGKEDMVGDGLFIGRTTSEAYTYKGLGLWTDSAEDKAEMAKFNANGHNFAPGMTRVEDVNGDYKIDANNDRQHLGNTRPLWNLGFNNTLRYKRFQLDVFMYGRMGWFVSTGNGQNTANPSRRINYYTENNKNSTYQRPCFGIESSEDSYSGNLIQRRNAFLKVRQISLGYILPDNFVRTIGLSSVKVNAQLKNPFSVYDVAFWMDSDAGSPTYNRGLVVGLDIRF